jgi:uncharacterized membrane protein YukC
MNTIIMIFALPIGLFLLLGEKKAQKKYQAIFDEFYKTTVSENLDKKKRTELFKNMLVKNHYNVKTTDSEVIGEKKIFSIGWLFVGIGTLYVGLLVYIVYYLYFQKPHIVRFSLDS